MRHLRFALAMIALLLATANLWAGEKLKGSKIMVRTTTQVSSDQSMLGDPVEGVLVNDLVVNGKLIAPSGASVRGTVSEATPSRRGKTEMPGSVSIRMETIETSEATYHLSTNEYTREGRGRSQSPFGSSRGGVSVDSVGGVRPQSPIPNLGDPNSVTIASGGLEAIIPSQTIVTFKASAISSPDKKK